MDKLNELTKRSPTPQMVQERAELNRFPRIAHRLADPFAEIGAFERLPE